MVAMTPTQHILVVADETATGGDLHRTVRAFAADPAARVHVVAPAPNGASAQAAEQRLRMCIAQLEDLGLDVQGHVGDADPLQGIADALAFFPATELVIAAHPAARSNWLADDLVDTALARFGLPTVHMAVEVIAPRSLVAV